MARKVLKENSQLNDRLHIIEELLEKSNIQIIPIIVKNQKYEKRLILKQNDRYFKFINDKGQEVNEFPPREIGRYYLCDKFGNDIKK